MNKPALIKTQESNVKIPYYFFRNILHCSSGLHISQSLRLLQGIFLITLIVLNSLSLTSAPISHWAPSCGLLALTCLLPATISSPHSSWVDPGHANLTRSVPCKVPWSLLWLPKQTPNLGPTALSLCCVISTFCLHPLHLICVNSFSLQTHRL